MPDFRNDIAGLGSQRPDVARSHVGAPLQEGVYDGAKARVIDVNSLIADAAEELTSGLSEETEKDVSEREVERGRREDSLKRLMKVQDVEELLQKFADMDKSALERALQALLTQRQSARQLREQARQRFKDAAHQYVLLKALAAGLRARGASAEDVAEADAAVASLMTEEGTSVQAALNIAETVSEFSAGNAGTAVALRDAYYDHLRDYSSMSATLDDLIERFGSDDLENSIQFMTSALGADLAAAGPSIEITKLRVILDDMHRLKSLTTIKGRCDGMMKSAQRQGAREDADGLWLLRELIPLQDAKWIKPSAIEKMPQEVGLDDVERQIRFFNDLDGVVRMIPIKCFVKADSREKLLDAVRHVTDAAVQREEEEEYLEEDSG